MSQISHIKYKDITEAGRFDADFFKPEYLLLREKIKNMKNEKLISFLLNDKVITGHTPSKQNEKFYGGNIKFIKTDNLRENYINHNFNDYLSEQGNDELRASELKKGDIIVTIIGASEKVVGRVSIVREEDLPANINQNIGLIRVNQNKINPDLLNIYLNCKYGRGYLHSLSRQTEQVNLNCREVENILVPIFSQVIQQEISKIVQTAYNKNQKSKQLYQEAEDLLLTELGLKNHTVSHTLTFSTTKKAVDEAGRYDADYFQPKYDELIEKIENYKGGYFSFSDKEYVKIIRGSLIPDKYYNEEEGTPYIRGADFSSGTLGFDKLVYIDKSFNKQNESVVYSGNIVFSLIGSVGSTALVTEEFNNSFISNNVGYLKLNGINPESVQIMLQSTIGQMQIERLKTQTAQPKISPEQMMQIKLPLISLKLQKQISDKIKESFKLRNESKELLEQAKKMVEDEIEKE